MVALLFTAAIAAQPPAKPAEQFDLECLRASALATSLSGDPARKQAFTTLALFYMGRLSGRNDADTEDWSARASAQSYPASSDPRQIQEAINACRERMRTVARLP